VALTDKLFGRSAVAPAAIAFTIGSMSAPVLAAFVQRRGLNGRATWTLLATAMVVVWPFAPSSLVMLCLAQVTSGFAMTALEGLLDADVASRTSTSVTGALARMTAGRAMGAAAATAVLPIAVTSLGLTTTTLLLSGLLSAGLVSFGVVRWGRRIQEAGVDAPAGAAAPTPVEAVGVAG
jgi:hypothetical protein